ncbi:sugar ABC transporter ATP-binding protein [Actinomadura sp. DC4]|uniref:sugar ABC transporter ATP-binding protein n=1 Tax=Actinomadura sp. DC4 TaxID=3055069 RepID=UPI0025AECEF7|nr:sugar ABC transporter ATP-binding protein [Actinomadura sp. DC4]MDN3359080.1 sugar ABC transporter ATP-binding protein [Actinomadura sp. DC4]
MTGHSTVPRLELEGVSKTFGRHRALRDVRLRIMPGELHGLVGQNGSGKSTLAKILTGFHDPDPGAAVRIDGEPLRLPVRLRQARDLGLAVVHQTLGLFEDATVLDNIRIGRFGATRWSRRIQWDREREAAGDVLAALGRSVRLDARVGALSAEDKATVAIARALQQARDGEGIVIFDESTRALGRDSLGHFYELVEGVLATGTAVLLISHRLDEVLQVTDAVTVLRDGEVMESGARTADLDHARLVKTMLGYTPRTVRPGQGQNGADRPRARRAGSHRPAGRRPGGAHAETPPAAVRRPEAGPGERVAARITGLTGEVLRDLTLTIECGEVVGVTGLVGSGHEELPYLVSGVRRAGAGTLTIGGTRLDLTRCGCGECLTAGLALVPEDRDADGLAGAMSVAENITLPQVRARGTALRVDRRWEREEVRSLLQRLGVRPPVPEMPVSALSGGNRQKVLLAKWLATRPDLLVLHEPTQAVDVGARRDIIAAVRAATEDGCGVLVAGADEEEMAALCDRVVVLDQGVIGTVLRAPLSADIVAEMIYSSAKLPLRPAQRWSAERT